MSTRWDERYASGEADGQPPHPLIAEVARIATAGHALDLACGLGRHTRFLSELGWHVTAVDNSEVAIRRLRERAWPNVDVVCADLERFEYLIAPDSFDLIIDCLYLQRSLFPAIRTGVRPGGLFAGVFATSGINPAFIVEPGEMRGLFQDWELLQYAETEGRAVVLARRPGPQHALHVD